jgi:hypothetical protein
MFSNTPTGVTSKSISPQRGNVLRLTLSRAELGILDWPSGTASRNEEAALRPGLHSQMPPINWLQTTYSVQQGHSLLLRSQKASQVQDYTYSAKRLRRSRPNSTVTTVAMAALLQTGGALHVPAARGLGSLAGVLTATETVAELATNAHVVLGVSCTRGADATVRLLGYRLPAAILPRGCQIAALLARQVRVTLTLGCMAPISSE